MFKDVTGKPLRPPVQETVLNPTPYPESGLAGTGNRTGRTKLD